MNTRIYRSREEPRRQGLSWEQRWKDQDKGLINCWEIGRDLRQKDPDLAKRAENGELPVSDWKGGVEKKLKIKAKYGALFYLAEWQGLRGEDLNIDLDKEVEIVCSRTEQLVIFTPDRAKYG